MMKAATLLALFMCLSAVTAYTGIGDRLLRAYTKYNTVPTTAAEAKAAGWMPSNGTSCQPNLGVQWNYNSNKPGEHTPVSLYFTPAGQVAGIAVTMFGTPQDYLQQQGYWVKTADEEYTLKVSFRDPKAACSNQQLPEAIGDQLVINQDGISVSVPTEVNSNLTSAYVKGACFESMGYHYFKDLSGSKMSWRAEMLMPIVPMYTNDGKIQAFFFASTDIQQGLFNANWWEPVALPNFLMCKNWCDSSCTFTGTYFWSTMHIYFRDVKQATCAGGCTIGCCP